MWARDLITGLANEAKDRISDGPCMISAAHLLLVAEALNRAHAVLMQEGMAASEAGDAERAFHLLTEAGHPILAQADEMARLAELAAMPPPGVAIN